MICCVVLVRKDYVSGRASGDISGRGAAPTCTAVCVSIMVRAVTGRYSRRFAQELRRTSWESCQICLGSARGLPQVLHVLHTK